MLTSAQLQFSRKGPDCRMCEDSRAFLVHPIPYQLHSNMVENETGTRRTWAPRFRAMGCPQCNADPIVTVPESSTTATCDHGGTVSTCIICDIVIRVIMSRKGRERGF